MRGVVFAAVLTAAGCTLETNTLDTTPGHQAGGTGGFDSGMDASGGQAGNVATGGLAGSTGASGEAGAAGSAGQANDAGSDVQTEAEVDSGEDAVPDGGTDAGEDSASDAAGEAEAGLCDWCAGSAGWSCYASVGCWKPSWPTQGGCYAIPPPSGPEPGKFYLYYDGSFWKCPTAYQKPPECAIYSPNGNYGWWNCPFTP